MERLPRGEAYELIAETLRRLGYARLARPDKGLLVRYLIKVTGLSRQQVTRLIGNSECE